MNVAQVRRYALSLPDTTEEPHFEYSSFRVRGKIFVTVPPDEEHIHVALLNFKWVAGHEG
jgi:YjbR